jgi:hypothetical protein
MIHGDPTCYNEENEQSGGERKNGKKLIKKKKGQILNQ